MVFCFQRKWSRVSNKKEWKRGSTKVKLAVCEWKQEVVRRITENLSCFMKQFLTKLESNQKGCQWMHRPWMNEEDAARKTVIGCDAEEPKRPDRTTQPSVRTKDNPLLKHVQVGRASAFTPFFTLLFLFLKKKRKKNKSIKNYHSQLLLNQWVFYFRKFLSK